MWKTVKSFYKQQEHAALVATFQTAEGYKPTVQSGLNDPTLPDNTQHSEHRQN